MGSTIVVDCAASDPIDISACVRDLVSARILTCLTAVRRSFCRLRVEVVGPRDLGLFLDPLGLGIILYTTVENNSVRLKTEI